MISQRIKEIRKDYNLTQKEFGKKIGVSDAHISKIEANKDNPSDPLIKLICIEFKINEEWLRYGTGSKSSDYSKVVKEAMEDESLDLSKPEVSQKYIKLFAALYSELIDMLGPGGALPGRLPFKDEPELIDIINYLQHEFNNVKELTDKLRIAVKFEYAFPDYKNVIEVLKSDYLSKREKIREDVSKYDLPKIELPDEGAATSEFYDMSEIKELAREDVKKQFKAMLEELKAETSVNYLQTDTIKQPSIKQSLCRTNRNQIIFVKSGAGKSSVVFSKLRDLLRDEAGCIPNMVCEHPKSYVPNLGKVAAGPPIDLIEDNTGLNPVFGSKDIDFTLQISGDSMEPDFPDGSYVFIKKEETLENGEIGIVAINDQVVCKKFYKINGTVELRSINKKYDPIILSNGDIRILGKVVKD